MRARCVKTRDQLEGVRPMAPSLRIGEEYVVLDLASIHNKSTSFNLIKSDIDGPTIWDARQFEVADPTIPDHWVVNIHDGGRWVSMGPPEFMVEGFWEDFHNGNHEAVKTEAQELVRRGIDVAGTNLQLFLR